MCSFRRIYYAVFIIIVTMLVGYNTNISYKGTVYHVQTEDSGIKNPHITTLLYHKGTILSSKKINYANIAAAPDYREKVRELMKDQHKAMIKELIAGKHTHEQTTPQPTHQTPAGTATESEDTALNAAETPSGAEQEMKDNRVVKSLDDILLDYILKEEKN